MQQGSKPVCEAHTDRAEAGKREEYKSITTSATAARRLWHFHLLLNHSTISQEIPNKPSLPTSVPTIMSSSTVSKKPTQEATAPTRSGMVDSREESTKASASV